MDIICLEVETKDKFGEKTKTKTKTFFNKNRIVMYHGDEKDIDKSYVFVDGMNSVFIAHAAPWRITEIIKGE